MEKALRILAVCGMGVGTSMILKTQAEKALKALDTKANVELADISTAKGLAIHADIVVTSDELAERIGEINTPVVKVSNFMDLEGMIAGLRAAISEIEN
jgi:PTS system ascorbate-specific IIB component